MSEILATLTTRPSNPLQVHSGARLPQHAGSCFCQHARFKRPGRPESHAGTIGELLFILSSLPRSPPLAASESSNNGAVADPASKRQGIALLCFLYGLISMRERNRENIVNCDITMNCDIALLQMPRTTPEGSILRLKGGLSAPKKVFTILPQPHGQQ
jgi:hypothetical protein